jgi:hypothetical protein
MTLLVNSKTPRKAILHPTLEGQRDRDAVWGNTLLGYWKFDGPDLTNRVNGDAVWGKDAVGLLSAGHVLH